MVVEVDSAYLVRYCTDSSGRHMDEPSHFRFEHVVGLGAWVDDHSMAVVVVVDADAEADSVDSGDGCKVDIQDSELADSETIV